MFNVIRRLFNKKKFVEVDNVGSNKLKLIAPINYIDKIDSTSVCFLNVRRNFDDISDWACMDESKLWRYNLHYFDYLLDDGASESLKDKLIDDWIEISHTLREDAWEPYPISLRLVNWVKYFIAYKNNSIPETWLYSLYQQAHILYNSIEYHILANHYLKNGKGLLFAGAYLQGKSVKKWLNKGEKILIEELSEQLLEDGGHYEKSPMYHSILLEDYLDVINLIDSNALTFDSNNLLLLREKVSLALDFLGSIIMPDGEIPLFNDSAFKIAPNPEALFNYSNSVIGYEKPSVPMGASIESLDGSGYYTIRDKQDMCVIDCGSISPDYQPGHTHCDLLSYELAIEGCRLIVNSGLYDYEKSEDRLYCRSTRAHNTVEIDGLEQSEIWGSFRVARRADILTALSEKHQDGVCVFTGSYAPYWSGKKSIVHSRVLKYVNKCWTISDEVSGEGEHSVNNFIHIHPDVDCIEDNGEYFLMKDDYKLAKITFSGAAKVSLEEGWYCPEFGVKQKNSVLRLVSKGSLPICQSYAIEACSNI